MIDTLFLFAVFWSICFAIAWGLVGITNLFNLDYPSMVMINKIHGWASSFAAIFVIGTMLTIYAHYFGLMG